MGKVAPLSRRALSTLELELELSRGRAVALRASRARDSRSVQRATRSLAHLLACSERTTTTLRSAALLLQSHHGQGDEWERLVPLHTVAKMNTRKGSVRERLQLKSTDERPQLTEQAIAAAFDLAEVSPDFEDQDSAFQMSGAYVHSGNRYHANASCMLKGPKIGT